MGRKESPGSIGTVGTFGAKLIVIIEPVLKGIYFSEAFFSNYPNYCFSRFKITVKRLKAISQPFNRFPCIMQI